MMSWLIILVDPYPFIALKFGSTKTSLMVHTVHNSTALNMSFCVTIIFVSKNLIFGIETHVSTSDFMVNA